MLVIVNNKTFGFVNRRLQYIIIIQFVISNKEHK